jgi:enterobactin synthetase component D
MSALEYVLSQKEDLNRPFVLGSQFCCDPVSGIFAVYCHFDVNAFHPGMFTEFAVKRPIQLKNAVVKRQAEYLAGRIAAQQVLYCSGLAGEFPETVAMGQDRRPVWPEQVLGSISHTTDKAIAVVTSARHNHYVGVDIERHLTLNTATEIAPTIHSQGELGLLLRQGIPAQQATTLIFSAKESLFKALYPFIGEYFGFECAKVRRFSLRSNCLYLDFIHPLAARHGLNKTYRCRFMLEPQAVMTLISGRTAYNGADKSPMLLQQA